MLLFGLSLPEGFNDIPLLRQNRRQHEHSAHLPPFYGLWTNGWALLHDEYCNESDQTIVRNWLPKSINTTRIHLHKAWQSTTDQMTSHTSSKNHFQHYQARNLYQLRSRAPPQFRKLCFPDDINTCLIHSPTLTINNWIKSCGCGQI